jgi:hypothetical protein
LATGERITANQEAEMDAKGWSLAKGGIMPLASKGSKDRERDREDEDNSSITNLGQAFSTSQDIDWEDAQMKQYVEEQIRVAEGTTKVTVDTRTEYEKQEQALYVEASCRFCSLEVWLNEFMRAHLQTTCQCQADVDTSCTFHFH